MTTVLLVDDDPLQAYVHKSILRRHFKGIQRATDAAEAFILIEDPSFAQQLILVVVGLNRPGLGSPAFVAELTSRLPAVPVLVLGRNRDEAPFFEGSRVRFLPRTATPEQILAVCRQMTDQSTARVA